MRWMWDSDQPADVPVETGIVAGYVDGKGPWTEQDWLRFPGVPQVRINRTGAPDRGNCLDVETGAATPGEAAGWFDTRHAAGVPFLTIYAARSSVGQITAAMGNRPWHLWLATLDGTMHDPHPNLVAVQFAGESMTGRHADASIVYRDDWHPAPAAVPPGQVAKALQDARSAVTLIGETGAQLDALVKALQG